MLITVIMCLGFINAEGHGLFMLLTMVNNVS